MWYFTPSDLAELRETLSIAFMEWCSNNNFYVNRTSYRIVSHTTPEFAKLMIAKFTIEIYDTALQEALGKTDFDLTVSTSSLV